MGSIPASRTRRPFFNVSQHLKTRMLIGMAGFCPLKVEFLQRVTLTPDKVLMFELLCRLGIRDSPFMFGATE